MDARHNYATRGDLAILGTRLVERIAGVETRLTAQITNLTWRLLGLLTAVAAVAIAFTKYL